MPNFDDICGQEQIKEHLQNGIASGKISHAYILNGEKESGKEFIANIFAMALQCETSKGNPCQTCHSCKQALSNNHPDIIHVTHEKPNTLSVDDIRSQVNNDVGIKPYSSQYKIYIISEAEKMNQQAQNAILKTLEEPPEYVIILLLTTNVNAFLPTILSRCVVLNMKPVSDEIVRDYLMREMKLPDYKADVCTAFGRGNIGKARILAMSEDFDTLKNETVGMLRDVHSMKLNQIVDISKKATEYKNNIDEYFDIILMWYRDVLLVKASGDLKHVVFKEDIYALKAAAKRCRFEGIETIIRALEVAKKRINANVNFELVIQLLIQTIQDNG